MKFLCLQMTNQDYVNHVVKSATGELNAMLKPQSAGCLCSLQTCIEDEAWSQKLSLPLPLRLPFVVAAAGALLADPAGRGLVGWLPLAWELLACALKTHQFAIKMVQGSGT